MKPGTSSDSAPSSDWVRGSRQFGEDMLTNRELPRQVDRAPFKVGGKYRHGQGRSGVSQRDVRAAAVRALPRKYLCPAPGDVAAANQQVLRHR